MAALCKRKHLFVHALNAELDAFHAVRFENIENFRRNVVRTGGKPDRIDFSGAHIRIRVVKQTNHEGSVDSGKTAAEKGDLNVRSRQRHTFECRVDFRADVAIRLFVLARDRALIAENTGVRTALMRNKDRNIGVLFHY